MPRIREFERQDIAKVAELWMRAFGQQDLSVADNLESYFDQVFFSNPWHRDELPSLIYEDGQRRVAGFVGVVPRTMKFLGTPVQVAVASQLVVDRSRPSPFTPIQMLRRLFDGPQDLTFSDGANELARKMWEAAGGSVAMLYSPVWTRILRPAQYVMSLCEEQKFLYPMMRACLPLGWAVDAAAVRIQRSPYWVPEQMGQQEEPSDETLLCSLRRFSCDRALQPDYDLSSFQWLLERAAEQRMHGRLQRAIVRDENGEICGWYLYYVKPRGVSQVLQLGAKPRAIGNVLNHLFFHARRQGAVAVSGQVEPRFALETNRQHCSFSWPGGVLVHSRNKEILDAIHRGDAFLTRLDGEWWMRFCDLRGAN